MYLIVGSGPMAKEYAKPLIAQNIDFQVIGRGVESCKKFESGMGLNAMPGGIEKFLQMGKPDVKGAIVAVGVEALFSTSMLLLDSGVKNILVEKPAGLNVKEIEQLAEVADKKEANIYVAYNRRFFSSVRRAKEIIEADGGVTSFNFELTEWSHVIEPLQKAPGVKESWFLANTTHIVDLAFHLGGKPKSLSSYVAGSLDWHSSGSNYVGSGVSDNGALFSYSGNWEAPGRWSLDILTRKSRLIFRPLEELQIQKIGSIKQEKIDINDSLDKSYKPGLYLQVESFINEEYHDMCSIHEHLDNVKYYIEMAGYN